MKNLYQITENEKVQTNILGYDFKAVNHKGEGYRIYPDGIVEVFAPFEWEGASPKFKLFGKYFGTWDGKIINGKPQIYYATLVHDVMYLLEDLRIDRKQIDLAFLDLMQKSNFKLAKLYYIFVRIFGGLYWNYID